jgi:hypothetical protein
LKFSREDYEGNVSSLFEHLQAVGFNDHVSFDQQLTTDESGVLIHHRTHGVTPSGWCYVCFHFEFDSATTIIQSTEKATMSAQSAVDTVFASQRCQLCQRSEKGKFIAQVSLAAVELLPAERAP